MTVIKNGIILVGNQGATQQTIDTEINRAISAEESIASNLEAEILRATSAENELSNSISLKADKQNTYIKTEIDEALQQIKNMSVAMSIAL